jgi:hypothetical protein
MSKRYPSNCAFIFKHCGDSTAGLAKELEFRFPELIDSIWNYINNFSQTKSLYADCLIEHRKGNPLVRSSYICLDYNWRDYKEKFKTNSYYSKLLENISESMGQSINMIRRSIYHIFDIQTTVFPRKPCNFNLYVCVCGSCNIFKSLYFGYRDNIAHISEDSFYGSVKLADCSLFKCGILKTDIKWYEYLFKNVIYQPGSVIEDWKITRPKNILLEEVEKIYGVAKDDILKMLQEKFRLADMNRKYSFRKVMKTIHCYNAIAAKFSLPLIRRSIINDKKIKKSCILDAEVIIKKHKDFSKTTITKNEIINFYVQYMNPDITLKGFNVPDYEKINKDLDECDVIMEESLDEFYESYPLIRGVKNCLDNEKEHVIQTRDEYNSYDFVKEVDNAVNTLDEGRKDDMKRHFFILEKFDYNHYYREVNRVVSIKPSGRVSATRVTTVHNDPCGSFRDFKSKGLKALKQWSSYHWKKTNILRDLKNDEGLNFTNIEVVTNSGNQLIPKNNTLRIKNDNQLNTDLMDLSKVKLINISRFNKFIKSKIYQEMIAFSTKMELKLEISLDDLSVREIGFIVGLETNFRINLLKEHMESFNNNDTFQTWLEEFNKVDDSINPRHMFNEIYNFFISKIKKIRLRSKRIRLLSLSPEQSVALTLLIIIRSKKLFEYCKHLKIKGGLSKSLMLSILKYS